MRLRTLTIVMLVAALGVFGADPASAQGKGKGKGKGKGGAQGAPLPLLGGTLLGQGVVIGGGYLLWRRRRKKAKDTAEKV